MTHYAADYQPVHHCTLCEDTGFLRGSPGRGLECPGHGRCGIAGCGRDGHTIYAHTYTRGCSCRATNPVLVELRARANEKASATDAAKRRTTAA